MKDKPDADVAEVTVQLLVKVRVERSGSDLTYSVQMPQPPNVGPVMLSRAMLPEEMNPGDHPWTGGGVGILDPRQEASNGPEMVYAARQEADTVARLLSATLGAHRQEPTDDEDGYPCVCGYTFTERWDRESHWSNADDGQPHGIPAGTRS